MRKNDQEVAHTGEAAAGKEPGGYPPILETLRHFWLEFAAKAQLRDFNAGRTTVHIIKALELEAIGYIQLRIAQEQIAGVQREEDMALVEQVKEDVVEWEILMGNYYQILEDFLSAAEHWQQASDSLELCAVCQTIGVTPEALALVCMEQRLRILRQVTSIMERRCALQRARLHQAGHQEIMFF